MELSKQIWFLTYLAVNWATKIPSCTDSIPDKPEIRFEGHHVIALNRLDMAKHKSMPTNPFAKFVSLI